MKLHKYHRKGGYECLEEELRAHEQGKGSTENSIQLKGPSLER